MSSVPPHNLCTSPLSLYSPHLFHLSFPLVYLPFLLRLSLPRPVLFYPISSCPILFPVLVIPSTPTSSSPVPSHLSHPLPFPSWYHSLFHPSSLCPSSPFSHVPSVLSSSTGPSPHLPPPSPCARSEPFEVASQPAGHYYSLAKEKRLLLRREL